MGEKINKRAPHPMDIHVGSRVRLRRMMRGISQDRLGDELGLTFQQVQKYEKGVNRIGASRLFDIARVLDVPVQFFYDDFHGTPATGGFAEPAAPGFVVEDKSDFLAALATPEGMQLARAFARVREASVRRRILELVRTLADEAADAKAD